MYITKGGSGTKNRLKILLRIDTCLIQQSTLHNKHFSPILDLKKTVIINMLLISPKKYSGNLREIGETRFKDST